MPLLFAPIYKVVLSVPLAEAEWSRPIVPIIITVLTVLVLPPEHWITGDWSQLGLTTEPLIARSLPLSAEMIFDNNI